MTDTLSSEVEGLFPVEGEVTEQPEQQAEPAQVEQAPEATEVTEAPAEAKTEDQEEEKTQQHVPLGVFLDKRDEAKELKRRLAEAEQRIQQFQKPPEPVRIPDPYEDPEGYTQYQASVIQDQAFQIRLDMSAQFAEQAHGKETVEAAVQWAQGEGAKDPTFGYRMRQQQNPVGWVVEQYNRDQFFTKYGSDPSALSALTQPPPAPSSQVAPQTMMAPVVVTQKKQAPPRSLASAPSTSGHQAIPNGAVLDSVKFNLD